MDRIKMLYDIRMESNDEAEIMIYGGITSEKWDDSEVTATDFDKAVKEAKKGGAKKLTVRINSGGGSVFQAVAMRSILMNAGMDAVNIKIEGLCASAATLISTVPNAHVTISKGSEFMIHNPSTCVWGNAEDLEKEAQLLRKMEDDFVQMYCDRSGNGEQLVRDWMREETWFTAQEAVSAGFADEVIGDSEMAACADKAMMSAMMHSYKHLPECIEEKDNHADEEAASEPRIVDTNQITKTEETQMDEETKVVVDTQEAVRMAIEAERQRVRDIREMTPMGCESMMQDAIDNGTDAMTYMKSVVAAQKQKGEDFMKARAEETAKAKTVSGGEPTDAHGEDNEMAESAKQVAEYAKQIRREISGGMY